MSNLITVLKPWITSFSEEIPKKYSHGDPLYVGGKIKRIFDLNSITNDENFPVQITIDDSIGNITLFIDKRLYEPLSKKNNFEIDSVILAGARIWDPLYLLNSKHRDAENCANLMCYGIKTI